MKIIINDEIIYEINEKEIDYLYYYVNSDSCDKIIKDKIINFIKNYLFSCKDQIKQEWLLKLFKRVKQIPTDENELFALIKSQPDYLTQKQKEANEKAKREAKFQVS